MFVQLYNQINRMPVAFWFFLFSFTILGSKYIPGIIATQFPSLFGALAQGF